MLLTTQSAACALEKMALQMKNRDFSPVYKLKPVLMSNLTAFNSQMDGEAGLAANWDCERYCLGSV